MALCEALGQGLALESLTQFYFLARSLLVKHEAKFDLFDQVFAEHFQGVEEKAASFKDALEQWLEEAKNFRKLDAEEIARLEKLDLAELKKRFEERLDEQKERHDGGNRWIGTGGTSPFGHGGAHPSGMRVHGESGMRSALQVAAARRFRNLRGDAVLDTRDLGLALKKLRRLARDGAPGELDVEGTVRATAKNAGEIELVMQAERRNAVRLLLLMDVGGSMSSHSALCERLFTAAAKLSRFKEFKHYYFHNCMYETLFTDVSRMEGEPTLDVLQCLDDSWMLIVVGDAAMSPYELTAPGGSIDYFHHNEEPGLVWMARVRQKIPHSVWLNPEPEPYWQIPSTRLVRGVFPEMYPLSLEGLGHAVEQLRRQASCR